MLPFMLTQSLFPFTDVSSDAITFIKVSHENDERHIYTKAASFGVKSSGPVSDSYLPAV